MRLDVGKAIKAILDPVSRRVYALRAEANTPMPYIVYRRMGINQTEDVCKDAPADVHSMTMQIGVYASDYPTSVEVASKVIEAVSSADLDSPIAGVSLSEIELVDGDEDWTDDGDACVQTLIFNIR